MFARALSFFEAMLGYADMPRFAAFSISDFARVHRMVHRKGNCIGA